MAFDVGIDDREIVENQTSANSASVKFLTLVAGIGHIYTCGVPVSWCVITRVDPVRTASVA
jgi:hypothetical protein